MVYIKNINKKIFPYYIRPEENELFSSWLCRLSYNHGVKPHSFIKNYFKQDISIWNRDVDTFTNTDLINKFEEHTPLNKTELNNLFLKSYDGYITDQYRPNGTNRNILPLGINHRKRKQYGLQCCTKCLKEGNPYYRKSWRLLTSVVCVKCNHILLDRCFICQAPIVFFRVNMDINSSVTRFRPIYYCFNCNTDLRTFTTLQRPTDLEIEYQSFIDDTIENGYNWITNYSFTYIRALLLLALRIRSSTKNNRFRDIIRRNYKFELEPVNKEIRFWNIEQRRETFPFIYYLLKDYPNTISRLFKEGKLIRAYLVRDNEYIPYWLQKCLIY